MNASITRICLRILRIPQAGLGGPPRPDEPTTQQAGVLNASHLTAVIYGSS